MMNIAYVTTYDSSDVHQWSGIGYFMREALRKSGFQISTVGNLKSDYSLLLKLKKLGYLTLLRKRFLWEREPEVLKSFSAQVEKALSKINYDIVLCPGTSPITYLKIDKPIVVWLDSIFAGGLNYYSYYSNLCAETIKKGNLTAQLALSTSSLVLFASDWAAKTAIDNYDVDPEKVKVVPFGANIICDRKQQDIIEMTSKKTFDKCKLLFVGVDWIRKGGEIVVEIAKLLNKHGLPTELHILGCTPEGDLPSFVKIHGFISKEDKEGKQFIDKLFEESHFLVVPSRAESYGLVFAEASSFGLPSLATKTGGIPTVIRDGKNGQTLPLNASSETYADFIENLMSSKQEYAKLALSSFREYSERLNWNVAGKKVNSLIEKYCS